MPLGTMPPRAAPTGRLSCSLVRPRRVLLLVASLVATLAIVLAGCADDGDSADGATTPSGSAVPVVTRDDTGAPVCVDTPPERSSDRPTFDRPPERTIDEAASYTATIETSCGTISIELDPRLAPVATNNFVFLAREGFYDGLTFHRVVPGFVIQGGDPAGDGTGGPGYRFADELPDDGYPPGSVAMANAGTDTNGSQFFIVTGDASALQNQFTRFGSVAAGLDVAQAIEALADPSADPGDPASQQPSQPVYIYRVTIDEA